VFEELNEPVAARTIRMRPTVATVRAVTVVRALDRRFRVKSVADIAPPWSGMSDRRY
jgi:hypothetical protein